MRHVPAGFVERPVLVALSKRMVARLVGMGLLLHRSVATRKETATVSLPGQRMTDVAPETEALTETVRMGLHEGEYRSKLSGLTDLEDVWWKECHAALDRLRSLLLRAEEERDEARASLTQLRSAWNAHFARCETPIVEGMTDEEFFKRLDVEGMTDAEFFKRLDEWKNAPSGTASA